jgi:hypothetical protein
MTPFKASIPGRIVWMSIAITLVSGGLIPSLGLHPATWVPITLLVGVMGCFVGTVLSIYEHPYAALALAWALPLSLWPYTMLLMLVSGKYPQYGWLFVAAGGGMILFGAAGMLKRPATADAPAKPSLA